NYRDCSTAAGKMQAGRDILYAKQPPPEAIGGGCPACVHLVKGKKKKEKTRAPAPMWPGARADRGALYSLRTGGEYCGEENKKRRQTLVCQRLCFRRAKYNAVCGKCQGSKAAFVELTSCAKKQGPGFGKMPKIRGRLRFRGRVLPPPAVWWRSVSDT